MRHSPSLPEIVRVDTSSESSAVAHLVSFLEPSDGRFNYLDATNAIQTAHRGLHNLDSLTCSTSTRAKRVGRPSNVEVIKLAAPLAFGRKTRVFQLPARKLPYGKNRLASYRIPFFYAEGGVLNAYFLQPRKNTHFSLEQYGLFAAIVERNLLQNEFYGEKYDIEIVDVSKPIGAKARQVSRHSLDSVAKWVEADVEEHFRIVDIALGIIENENLISKVRRPLKDPNLPLFD